MSRMQTGQKVTFRILRGEGDSLQEVDYHVEAETGWVVLDAAVVAGVIIHR